MTRWTLHHGDCLDPVSGLASLADRSVDHVIMDPPYEVEAHTKARRAAPKASAAARAQDGNIVDYEINFDPITEDVRSKVAEHCARVSRGWILAFCQAEGVVPWRKAFEEAEQGGGGQRFGSSRMAPRSSQAIVPRRRLSASLLRGPEEVAADGTPEGSEESTPPSLTTLGGLPTVGHTQP